MILDFTRDQIKKLVENGMLNKKSLRHYDVCKAIAEGKTQEQIAEELNYSETKSIRYIKAHKCKDCR